MNAEKSEPEEWRGEGRNPVHTVTADSCVHKGSERRSDQCGLEKRLKEEMKERLR